MSKHSRVQLSKLCGKDRAQVTVAIRSGRLVTCDDNKLIDDTHPVNKITISKWLSDYKAKEPAARPLIHIEPDAPIPEYKSVLPQFQAQGNGSLDDQKKLIEIRYKEAAALEKELKNAKLKGENIPTDLVTGVVRLLGRSFQNQYKEAALNLLTEISHKMRMDSATFSKYKKRLYDSVNLAHKNSIKEAEKGVNNVVNDESNQIVFEDGE